MDKAVYGVFLCLYIILPVSYACGTSDSPTTILDTYITISSPNFPDEYPNNAECHWLVQAAPGTKIDYDFGDTFRLESQRACEDDSVTLYDSPNTTKLIGSYCGRSLPNPGTTTGRYLYVIFKSNRYVTFTGFSLEITAKYDGCGTSDLPITYVLESGQNLHIMSPNYPEMYSKDKCYWLVQAATNSKLKYRFIGRFAVGKYYNYRPCQGHVTLYDSSNTTNVIGSYCAITRPDPGVTSGRYLYVVLNPDGGTFPGFNLEITLKDNECSVPDSPITYVLGSGRTLSITSPNYPDNYPDNQSLYWLVVTVPDSKLKYRFVDQFHMETEDQCLYDNVTLYDSANTTNVIGSYCGRSRPSPGTTTGRYLYVIFKSDGRATHAGFKLEITADYECGTFDSPTTYALDRGNTLFITSPNYPDVYPDNKSCYWLVQAAADCRIKYRFIDQFEIEAGGQCQYDNVTLYDSSNSSNVIGNYCGRSPPNPGITTGVQLYVSFKSDGRAKYAGFVLEITSKDYMCELSESPNTYILQRGQTIAITTTNYPFLYPKNEMRHWLVIAEQDSKLTYRFIGDYFGIGAANQCQYDNVTLYDSSTTTNVIGSYCGNTRPKLGTTTGRFLNVIFKSNDGNTGHSRGFELEIFSKNYECGASDSRMTFALEPGQTLNITSPNYPANYPNGEACHWLIEAAPDNKLKYRFIDRFRLQTSYKCMQDSVTLYDSSDTSDIIGIYCGMSRPNPGKTTGRYLYVIFQSGLEYRNAGFNLEITSDE